MSAREKQQLRQRLEAGLESCIAQHFPLPGITDGVRRDVFLRQLIDSIRRVQYVPTIAGRSISPNRVNGSSLLFDPIRAAVHKHQSGDFDEACWLVFLFVHFGKHPISGYRYTREVYSALGQQTPWTFSAVAADPAGLRAWLDQNETHLRRGTRKGFGNHRKYQSLSGTKAGGTGHAFESYTQWVQAAGGHARLFATALLQSGGSQERAFEWLYHSMNAVASFGRIGKFDYLTMLQKLGFADIRAGRPYLDAQTKGPNKGARAMFESDVKLSIGELELRTQLLGNCLGAGMQEMEDSLCNWGKNTSQYKYFRG